MPKLGGCRRKIFAGISAGSSMAVVITVRVFLTPVKQTIEIAGAGSTGPWRTPA
jgi:hypothetical protein